MLHQQPRLVIAGQCSCLIPWRFSYARSHECHWQRPCYVVSTLYLEIFKIIRPDSDRFMPTLGMLELLLPDVNFFY
jgi:hypothetical protein